MEKFTFTIVVECETEEQAFRVIANRIYVDEDYGFDYRISEE